MTTWILPCLIRPFSCSTQIWNSKDASAEFQAIGLTPTTILEYQNALEAVTADEEEEGDEEALFGQTKSKPQLEASSASLLESLFMCFTMFFSAQAEDAYRYGMNIMPETKVVT